MSHVGRSIFHSIRLNNGMFLVSLRLTPKNIGGVFQVMHGPGTSQWEGMVYGPSEAHSVPSYYLSNPLSSADSDMYISPGIFLLHRLYMNVLGLTTYNNARKILKSMIIFCNMDALWTCILMSKAGPLTCQEKYAWDWPFLRVPDRPHVKMNHLHWKAYRFKFMCHMRNACELRENRNKTPVRIPPVLHSIQQFCNAILP